MAIIAYLVAIVAANLSVAYFGPASAPINAFLFIGLDLTLRDRLHDRWSATEQQVKYWDVSGFPHFPVPMAVKMILLIGTGGIITMLLNADAGRIALASTVAFVIAATLDAVVYHTLRRKGWYARANGSNVAGAAADSLLFPTLAFGVFMPWVILGQFVAKVFGGAVWSFVIDRWRVAFAAAALLFVLLPASAQPILVSAHYDIGRDTPILSATYGQVLPAGFFAAGFAEVWYNHDQQYPPSRWVLFSKHWISRRVYGPVSASVEIEIIKNRAGVDFRAFDVWGGTRKVYVTPKVGLTIKVR